MELSLLRTCLAVYRTGSLTKAAKFLGISQPAVTGQLRTLEACLNQQLFVRLPRGTAPTEAGHELVRDTASALDLLETALRRRLQPERLGDRTVRLAGPAEVISARVLPAVADLITDGLRLEVNIGPHDELLSELAEGVHDLVITTTRPRNDIIKATPLMDEEYALVGSPVWARGLPACKLRAMAGHDLRGVPVIAYANSLPYLSYYWENVFDREPPFAAQVTVPDLRAVLGAVLAGAGISVLPTYLCADDLDDGRLVTLNPVEEPPLKTLYLAVRADGISHIGLAELRSHLLVKARLWR